MCVSDGSEDPDTVPFLEIADQKGNPLKIPDSEKKVKLPLAPTAGSPPLGLLSEHFLSDGLPPSIGLALKLRELFPWPRLASKAKKGVGSN